MKETLLLLVALLPIVFANSASQHFVIWDGPCTLEPRHSHRHLVEKDGGCDNVNVGPNQCLQILRPECDYAFFSRIKCRGQSVSANGGMPISSVRVSCGSDEIGNRHNWGHRNRGKSHHHDKHRFRKCKERKPDDRANGNDFSSRSGKAHHHDKPSMEEIEQPWYWTA